MIDRDLFAMFPDLPWPRIRRPKIRKLPRPRKPHDRRRASRRLEHDALRRIYAIAYHERSRAGAATVRGRSLAKIMKIASEGMA
jgi:hypothetical protein